MTPRHIESYYAATVKGLKERPALTGRIDCDVCVVGGGFTGLSTALHLAERGFDTVLLEAERLSWGASGRNGGQLGSGQRKDPEEVAQLTSQEDSRRLWDLAEEAKTLVKDLSHDPTRVRPRTGSELRCLESAPERVGGQ